MTLHSLLEKFACYFQIFNFLKIMATKGDCFPLSTKHKVTEFFILFQKSPV